MDLDRVRLRRVRHRPVLPADRRLAGIERLAQAGLVGSVGTTGDSYDDAAAEAVFTLLKTEFVRRQGPWRNLAHVELALSEWVQWCNTGRLHSWCSYTPPVEYEQQHYRDHPDQAAA